MNYLNGLYFPFNLNRTNKKKYQQIMTEKAAIGAGKKNRKSNKFRK